MEFEITENNFNELVMEYDGLALVDFWAVWCGPCMMEAPIIEELANELDDVTVGKVNVDEQPGLAIRFNVSAIPTLMLFKDGKCVETKVGFQSKEALMSMIEKHKE